MAIVAFASAHSDPVSNPNVDPVVDMSAVSLPQTEQLYAGAVDSTDPTATFTFVWYLMAIPTGSSVAFSSSTISNPVLQDIDTWGNVRCFVVATNTVTAETSSANPLSAPSSAFVVTRVLSAQQGIQKPAAGERNWFNDLDVWADRIEAMASATAPFVPHDIIDHDDVVDATGPDLEQLTGAGYADDPDVVTPNPANSFGRNLLHKHHGGDVDVATVSEPGTLYLDPAYSGPPLTPVAMTEDYFVLHCTVYNCMTVWGLSQVIGPGFTNPEGYITPLAFFPPTKGTGSMQGQFEIVEWHMALMHPDKPTGEYEFDLVKATQLYTAGTHPLIGAAVTTIIGSTWAWPITASGTDFIPWTASAETAIGMALPFGPFANDTMIGIRCTGSPPAGSAAHGLSCSLVCRRV